MGHRDAWQDRHQRRIEQERARRGGLLSTTKYRKLFAYFESLGIEHAQARMLCDDQPYGVILREFGDSQYTEDGCAVPHRFREIEELIIPIPDDLDPVDVCAGLNELGKFDWQLDSRVLTIRAYS